MIMFTANWTYERICLCDHKVIVNLLKLWGFILGFFVFLGLLLFDQFHEYVRPFVVCFPNTAHFQDGTKLGSFQFINEVIDFVGTVHEIRMWCVDCDLDFTIDGVVELGIDHDVICALFEPVLYSDDFELVWIFCTESFNLLEDFKDFFFLWSVFAPKKVWNIEGK